MPPVRATLVFRRMLRSLALRGAALLDAIGGGSRERGKDIRTEPDAACALARNRRSRHRHSRQAWRRRDARRSTPAHFIPPFSSRRPRA